MLAMHILMIVLALAAVVSPASCTVFAQQPQMVQPEPLMPNDPRAKPARTLVNLILKGDRAAVVQALQADGTPSFVKGPEFDAAVDAQIARLANKGYAVVDMMTGRGADVLIQLESDKAEPANLVIRYTTEEPHRIEGFTQARLVTGAKLLARIFALGENALM
jgi:hypothetical protein